MFLFLSVCANAQKPFHLQIDITGRDAEFIKKNITYPHSVSDSFALKHELNNVLIKCNELSFLVAEFSDVHCGNDTCRIKLNPGNSYKWIQLRKGNISSDILSAAGFREEQFHNKIFDPSQFSKRAERILNILEQTGYPFAAIRLDSIIADTLGITASMNLDKGKLIFFDTVDIRGTANIRRYYIEKYTGVKKGNPYNESLIKEMDSRLSQLPFLKNSRPSSIYFYGDKAMPVLFLENRKASSVDGIIGFAPSSQLNNKLLITGEANLKLQNIAGSGKSIDLNYRSFLSSSQDLKFKFFWPYIFRTNLGLDYQLDLLKYDSLFLDVKHEFGLQYRFIGTDYLKITYSLQTTSLITVDTNLIKATRALPQNSDIRYDQYGVGMRKSKYDYFLNPRKGYSIEFSAGVGVKKIVENSTIKDLVLYDNRGKPYSIYDTLKMEYVQYKLALNAEYFIPVFRRAAIRTQVNCAHIESQNLFFNELYRIGGIKTLKGFDEQSIFASSYVIINTELRYLLQQNSNFMLFWNGAWYRNAVKNPVLTDYPYGFGAGVNFETGAGIFSIYYAVGKQFANTIEFDKAKIHFGFVNYF